MCKAIITLEDSTNSENQSLLQSIYGAIFFGVPHQGMDIKALLLMCDNGPNIELIASLNANNSYILDLQRRQFPKALQSGGHTEMFCFYETVASPTAIHVPKHSISRKFIANHTVQDEETGKWSITGPEAFLVTKASATYCRPLEDSEEHICPLPKNHSELVKFDEDEHCCNIVLQKIQNFTKRAIGGRERGLESSKAQCT